MHEYSETYEKWRKMIFNINVLFVLFAFILEVVMYFLLKSTGMIFHTIPVYLISFLVIPTCVNVINVFVSKLLLDSMSPDNGLINYIPIIQMAFLAFVLASTHFIFSITLCALSLPIFTTVIFADKKMTTNITGVCFVLLALTLLSRRFSPFKNPNDFNFTGESIIAFAVLIAANIICGVLIKYLKEKSDTIHTSYLKELDLKEQLSRDQKTGLYGHTILMNTLAWLIAKASEEKDAKLKLAIIDIDDFKRVNDSYGHLKGDTVIVKLAELMNECQNDHRFMARFGGEEFAIIFTAEEADSSYEFLEELRENFQNQRYGFWDESITISIGVGTWSPGIGVENLFELADSAMYFAKLSGKNTTIVYGEEMEGQNVDIFSKSRIKDLAKEEYHMALNT